MTMEDTHQTMYLDPSSLPQRPEPLRLHEEAITVMAGMWETVLNRLASQQAIIEELRHELQTIRHHPCNVLAFVSVQSMENGRRHWKILEDSGRLPWKVTESYGS